MKITKILSLAAAGVMTLGMFTGCADANASEGGSDKEKLKVVATIFPEYDWAKEIIGDRAEGVELVQLADNGTDLHSYQPTVEDIAKISECDLFIYVGGESDGWVEDALSQKSNDKREVVCLMDVVGSAAKEEEIKEGMEAEEEEEEGEEEEGPEYDEHVWLSLTNAKNICTEIESRLEKVDPEGADSYKKNLAAYTEKLDALDKEYRDAVSAGAKNTVIFADRFPFRYLVDDYGLDYYAAFVGCSAETEASFETVVFLAGKVDELGINTILTIENSDGKLAGTVIENTAGKDQKVLAMDSLQATRSTDGKTYLGVMESDLEVLKQALS